MRRAATPYYGALFADTTFRAAGRSSPRPTTATVTCTCGRRGYRQSATPLSRIASAQSGTPRPGSGRRPGNSVRHAAQIRAKASVAERLESEPTLATSGPIQEYDARVRDGRLRDDEHQRGKGPPAVHSM